MTSIPGFCSVEVCDRASWCRGFCRGHYRRWKDKKSLTTPIRVIEKQTVCSVVNCPGRSVALHLCHAHYKRQQLGHALDKPLRIRGLRDRCVIVECSAPVGGWGMCDNHHRICSAYKISSIQLQMVYDVGCLICGDRKSKMHIDHDHACCTTENYKRTKCGKCNRGGLCQDCNFGLGRFRDDVDRLKSAIQYLTR